MKKSNKYFCFGLAIFVFLGCFPIANITIGASAANSYIINGVAVSNTDYSSAPNDCWTYANNIYKKIWGQNFNSYFNDTNNSLRNLSDSELTLNAENLKKYVSNSALGSCLRICNSDWLHSTDGWGHSQIIVQKDNNGFTVFEGGLSSSPYRREKYYTWSEYCNTGWLGGTYSYIKYIKWPDAPAYNSNNSHSHSYFSHYEADHPHRVYNKCSCGDWYYTGETKHLSSCSLCNGSVASTIIYPTNGGVYKIASGVGNNMYLDFACTSDNVQIYENCDGHSNPDFVKSQYFKLTHVGDGWYTITNPANGKAMDVYDWRTAPETNVQQWDLHGGDCQLFRFYDAGNGYCYIKSKLGTYVDVANAANVNNTNVWTYTFNGSNAQQWKLIIHKHSYASKVTEPATCTQDGLKEYTCSGCLSRYSETIPAKGHSYGKWFSMLFTSTNEIKQAKICSSCQDVQERNIAMLMGDIDIDGQVSVSDARMALREAVGLEHFDDMAKKLADIDFDKAVTVADARLILRTAVGLEKPFNKGDISDAPIIAV